MCRCVEGVGWGQRTKKRRPDHSIPHKSINPSTKPTNAPRHPRTYIGDAGGGRGGGRGRAPHQLAQPAKEAAAAAAAAARAAAEPTAAAAHRLLLILRCCCCLVEVMKGGGRRSGERGDRIDRSNLMRCDVVLVWCACQNPKQTKQTFGGRSASGVGPFVASLVQSRRSEPWWLPAGHGPTTTTITAPQTKEAKEKSILGNRKRGTTM